MQIRFSFALVFVFDKRYVLGYADQTRLRFVVKNICIPAYSFVLVLRCRLTNSLALNQLHYKLVFRFDFSAFTLKSKRSFVELFRCFVFELSLF